MLRRHRLLAGIVLAGLLVRVAYVLATRDWALRGDEIEYAAEGRFFAAGHPWWSALPYGIPHPSLWKAPAYPAWVGAWFSVLGPSLTLMRLAQALASCVTIVLTWALGRRLWGESVGLAGAAVVAVHPFAWDYDVGLFPEVFATPLTLLVLLLVLERPAGPRRAAVVGALVGVSLLIRPTAGLLLAPVLVALALRLGLRRGVALTALAGVSAALVLAPWAYRNHRVAGGFVPVSIQDSALYGTFNDDAAHDRTYPWAWRPVTRRDLDLFRRAQPLGDVALRSRLLQRARSYIADHPASLADAFFWNGLSPAVGRPPPRPRARGRADQRALAAPHRDRPRPALDPAAARAARALARPAPARARLAPGRPRPRRRRGVLHRRGDPLPRPLRARHRAARRLRGIHGMAPIRGSSGSGSASRGSRLISSATR